MPQQLCENVTYDPDLRMAHAVRVVDCERACFAHLELMDEHEVVFAIATCDEGMARFLVDDLTKRLAELARR